MALISIPLYTFIRLWSRSLSSAAKRIARSAKKLEDIEHYKAIAEECARNKRRFFKFTGRSSYFPSLCEWHGNENIWLAFSCILGFIAPHVALVLMIVIIIDITSVDSIIGLMLVTHKPILVASKLLDYAIRTQKQLTAEKKHHADSETIANLRASIADYDACLLDPSLKSIHPTVSVQKERAIQRIAALLSANEPAATETKTLATPDQSPVVHPQDNDVPMDVSLNPDEMHSMSAVRTCELLRQAQACEELIDSLGDSLSDGQREALLTSAARMRSKVRRRGTPKL